MRYSGLLLAALLLCIPGIAQDSDYYKTIQKGSDKQIAPKQFKQIEQDAFKNYSQPETYESLATTFSNTTEKVWTIVYGEVFCNLSADADKSRQMGVTMFDQYTRSLSAKGNSVSADLTKSAQASGKQPPFESQYEIAFLLGALPLGANVSPLSIRKLTDIRKAQLALLKQKNVPETELTKRQQTIISAGHFDAYNYWLFQSAKPDEFKEWLEQHQAAFQAWQDWQVKNKFVVERPDFQRLYFLKH